MGEFRGNHVVILHADSAHCGQIRQWLEPYGWICTCDAPADPFVPPADAPALFLMDGAIDLDRRIAIVAALRALPGPVSGTPLLLIADADAPGQNGISGRIALPWQQDQAIAAIEQWTGPLGDHGFRDLSSPHYRLVRLAGQDSARRLLLGFVDHAEAALARLDDGEDMARTAHNMAGLGGTLGYGELSRLWSAIDRGDSDDPTAAKTATRTVVDRLKSLFFEGKSGEA